MQSTKWRYPSLTPPGKTKSVLPIEPSILDESNPNSQLNKSDFYGFYNMAVIFFTVFLLTNPVLNWIQHGYFLQPYLYNTFKNDYILCVSVWPLFFGWSFTSFFLQKMIIFGINKQLALVFQHLTQLGLFIFSCSLVLRNNWCASHCFFVILQACAHFMKMHSYTNVNRDYRQQKAQALKQGTKPQTNYPQNVNLKDFILFMWTPWLVYDVYPRKQNISVAYILKKSIITIFCILMAYMIHTEKIMPLIETGERYGHVQLILRAALPTTLIFMLFFYIIFESITNIFAEITKLGHRKFYEDWWNSTTYEQFNRKWNRPVHIFLYRHVYLQLILRWNYNKARAQMITFLFSAMLHEFVVALVIRTVRPYFLGFIFFQIPLIYMTKFMKGKKSGMYLFWFGIIIGPSIIASCYFKLSDEVWPLFTRQI